MKEDLFSLTSGADSWTHLARLYILLQLSEPAAKAGEKKKKFQKLFSNLDKSIYTYTLEGICP